MMAAFVLAGKSDCPYYAKAELLADRLQRSLPNFRINKISVLPDAWKGWLETTCKRNVWKHDQSPLIWRELVDQGGKRMLLGGFNEFLEHCQDYYGITLDVPSDIMLSIAAENLVTKINLIEEQRRVSLIQPVQIWISSAGSPTCHLLIPNLISSEVFPKVSAISLHLLDLQRNEEGLQWLKMETEDLALPLLHQVTIHTDLELAFQEADVIILLEECWSDELDTENEDEGEKKKTVKGIIDQYSEYGQLIDTRAHREVKVIVSSGSFVNLKCSLLLKYARSIDSSQFVAMATQMENEARAIMAKKLKVKTSDITDVIVWGNISGSFYIDLQRAKVFNYDGAIRGPPFFSQPVLQIFHDRKWLETKFQELVSCRRADVAPETRPGAAMSSANGILTLLKAWNGTSGPNPVLSVGVLCSGHNNLPDGVVLSVPVTLSDGRWSVILDVTVGDDLKDRLRLCANELEKEEELGSEHHAIVMDQEEET